MNQTLDVVAIMRAKALHYGHATRIVDGHTVGATLLKTGAVQYKINGCVRSAAYVAGLFSKGKS